MGTTSWREVRDRRLADPVSQQSYQAAGLAFALGQRVKHLREDRDWTQQQLAGIAGMTQSAVARFEAGGTTPTLPVLERLAAALDADLIVAVEPRSSTS